MKLSAHDIRQLDDARLHQLRMQDPDRLEQVSVKLLADLKEALERLSQSPDNSSRPPSSRDPWWKGEDCGESEADTDRASVPEPAEDANHEESKPSESSKKDRRSNTGQEAKRPGKQEGAAGVARTQQVPITETVHHYPTECAFCGKPLPEQDAKCYTAYEVLDLQLGDLEQPFIALTNTKHAYYETLCPCGHLTREQPHCAPPEKTQWDGVTLSEWRLIGPGLAGFLSWLHFRMRVSARMCREFLLEVFGLAVSVGAIHRSVAVLVIHFGTSKSPK
jgi:transposase